MEDKGKALIEEARKVYEIPPQWVLAERYYPATDTVIIVTYGGKKVIHKIGEAAKVKLTMVEISGFLPKEELFWSEKLNQGVRLSELKKSRQL